jgi:phosphatidylglycerophosphate synthase
MAQTPEEKYMLNNADNQLVSRFPTYSRKNHRLRLWHIELVLVLPTTLIIWRAYGLQRMIGYLVGFLMAIAVQRTFLSAMMRKNGQQHISLADILTLSRAGVGTVLAGLVTSGIRDRKGSAGWIGWLISLLGVTDWLDGALARRIGPTQLGGTLDIEADSWFTLWSAAGAVAWGNLPAYCLLPPIIRYLDPVISLCNGNLPQGGGPWWSRLAGASQTGLFFIALAPFGERWRNRFLTIAALPVSTVQCVALLARKVL